VSVPDWGGFDLVAGFAFLVEVDQYQKSNIKNQKAKITQAQMPKHKYQIKFKIQRTNQKARPGQAQITKSKGQLIPLTLTLSRQGREL
jgi:hypothetical protein